LYASLEAFCCGTSTTLISVVSVVVETVVVGTVVVCTFVVVDDNVGTVVIACVVEGPSPASGSWKISVSCGRYTGGVCEAVAGRSVACSAVCEAVGGRFVACSAAGCPAPLTGALGKCSEQSHVGRD
jgi:hypothetical protein